MDYQILAARFRAKKYTHSNHSAATQTPLNRLESDCAIAEPELFWYQAIQLESDKLGYSMKPLIATSLILFSSLSVAQTLNIAQFSQENLDSWETKSFVGETQYSITQLDDQTVLHAQTDQSASGLAKEIKVDLKKTPFLNWTWRIENRLPKMDETSKAGDDYAARLYIVKSGGFFIWQTKALNYVWSSNQATGSIWDNAYAGSNARMLALRSPQDPLSTWVTEKRNVYADMIALYGDKGSDKANEEAYRYIDAVAIMSDTDDSKAKASAYYGNIYFTAQ